ncbi:hypothetical protein AB4851_17435 [Burkholderia sp. 22PA0099]|uniref:hypothetical protein n=1 Tax=Burkholderia sp. 22PA0099 TaxID=3237372 RepID=UPI0039C48CE3
MKMPDCLFGRSTSTDLDEPLLLGETGFSFARTQRPAAPLAQWAHGGVPTAARAALQAQAGFADPETLSYVPLERDSLGGVEAEWILARAAAGLLSIFVRDARGGEAGRMLDDMRFAVAEARRFRAAAALVFVQQARGGDLARCLDAVRAACQADAIIKPGRLHAAPAGANDLPAWFCCLPAN